MPKRDRVRARARRPVESVAQRAERVERERPERARPRYRGAPLPPGGSRAAGEPSPALAKAATLERTMVMKDMRRLGLVAGLTFVVLFASGLAVSAFLK